MSKYRAGVVGLGRMGSTFDDEVNRAGMVFLPYCHGPSYHYSPLVDLVAGADLDAEQRSLFGERWGVASEHLYEDYNEMVAKEKLDIVSVCTSSRHRSRIVQDLARGGVKAIWAEKPISPSLEEADAMVRVCREEGTQLAINCSRRWNPLLAEAKSIIDAGDLGDILQVTAYADCRLSSNGSHLLDLIRYLAGGEVEWVTGEMESDDEAEDWESRGNGYLAFDNGVRSYVRTMNCGPAYWELDVIGESGRIRSLGNAQEVELFLSADYDPESRAIRPMSGAVQTQFSAKYPFPWPKDTKGSGLITVEDLVASIETGRPPRCSGEDGVKALEIAIAMRESHRQGGAKVALPLEDRSLKMLANEMDGDEVPRRIRGLRRVGAR